MTSTTIQPSWLGRNWRWLLPAGCLGSIAALACVVAVFVGAIFGVLRSADVTQEALRMTRQNEQVVAALGEPIEPGLWTTGSISTEGSAGSANVTLPISGPRGSGTLSFVARRSSGRWRYTTVTVDLTNSGARIDVLGDR